MLTLKKGKSIAGEVPGDKHKFIISNDVLREAQEVNNEFSMKMVTYLSHKNFTFFRPENWQSKEETITINEEQIKQMRDYAL